MLEPSFELYASIFGAMKAGCIVVLFSPIWIRWPRLRVEDCRPKLIITNREKASIARGMVGLEVQITGQEFNDLLAIENKSFKFETTARDLAVYHHTSGTTRKCPKPFITPTALWLRLRWPPFCYRHPSRERFMFRSPAWGHVYGMGLLLHYHL